VFKAEQPQDHVPGGDAVVGVGRQHPPPALSRAHSFISQWTSTSSRRYKTSLTSSLAAASSITLQGLHPTARREWRTRQSAATMSSLPTKDHHPQRLPVAPALWHHYPTIVSQVGEVCHVAAHLSGKISFCSWSVHSGLAGKQ
jgi:hypothetical protein